MTPQATTTTTAEPEATPGPAARVQRTAAQLGGVLVFIELVQAFSWLGAGDWTERQAVAVTAALVFTVSTIQNLAGHLRSHRPPGRHTR